jgi:hypothetical protein
MQTRKEGVAGQISALQAVKGSWRVTYAAAKLSRGEDDVEGVCDAGDATILQNIENQRRGSNAGQE